jgi:hypothetical protein
MQMNQWASENHEEFVIQEPPRLLEAEAMTTHAAGCFV